MNLSLLAIDRNSSSSALLVMPLPLTVAASDEPEPHAATTRANPVANATTVARSLITGKSRCDRWYRRFGLGGNQCPQECDHCGYGVGVAVHRDHELADVLFEHGAGKEALEPDLLAREQPHRTQASHALRHRDLGDSYAGALRSQRRHP